MVLCKNPKSPLAILLSQYNLHYQDILFFLVPNLLAFTSIGTCNTKLKQAINVII